MKVNSKRVTNDNILRNLKNVEYYLERYIYEKSDNLPESIRRDAGREGQSDQAARTGN